MKEKKRKPPYLSGWLWNDFFNKIKSINVPGIVNFKTLQGWGIAKGQEHFLLSALRFLDLITEEGKPTPRFKKVQVTGEQFKTNLTEIIKESYSDLFREFKLDQVTPEDLANFFGAHYSQASKYKMVTAFGHLCRLAGMESPAFAEIRQSGQIKMKALKIKASTKPPSVKRGSKTPASETAINQDDRVLQLAKLMENWDAEKMKIFFDNIDKIKETEKSDEEEEK